MLPNIESKLTFPLREFVPVYKHAFPKKSTNNPQNFKIPKNTPHMAKITCTQQGQQVMKGRT